MQRNVMRRNVMQCNVAYGSRDAMYMGGEPLEHAFIRKCRQQQPFASAVSAIDSIYDMY
jgi:hypothetical protein